VDPTLAPTRFIDSDHPEVQAYARAACVGCETPREQAVGLFYAVRDGIRYDPYRMSTDPGHLVASRVLADGAGYCVPKAILLAACARAVGIPSRLGFADVVNHLTTEKLRERMGSDLFVYHGYTELRLDGHWVKVTPTFNRSLCERFGVKTLEFDGEHEALLQPYDNNGSRHMEYVRDQGSFDDVPVRLLIHAWQQAYPFMFKKTGAPAGGDPEWGLEGG
jgi:transglutaminase-like putative cysteine protease